MPCPDNSYYSRSPCATLAKILATFHSRHHKRCWRLFACFGVYDALHWLQLCGVIRQLPIISPRLMALQNTITFLGYNRLPRVSSVFSHLLYQLVNLAPDSIQQDVNIPTVCLFGVSLGILDELGDVHALLSGCHGVVKNRRRFGFNVQNNSNLIAHLCYCPFYLDCQNYLQSVYIISQNLSKTRT